MGFACRVSREALHHKSYRRRHVREGRMVADLIVTGELKRQEEEFLAFELFQLPFCRAALLGTEKILPAPTQGFQQRRMGPVRSIVWKAQGLKVDGDIMPG